jgi:hypothetical protein
MRMRRGRGGKWDRTDPEFLMLGSGLRVFGGVKEGFKSEFFFCCGKVIFRVGGWVVVFHTSV